MAVEEYTITIKGDNKIDISDKIRSLNLLAKLDSDALSKLAQLSTKPKAVASLKSKFGIIKTFLGV